MTISDIRDENRQQSNHTTAKPGVFSNIAMTGAGTSVKSGDTKTYIAMSGEVKSIKVWASNIPADATYTLNIYDIDGALVFTSTGITKNGFNFLNLTTDQMWLACGLYQMEWVFTTSQTLAANNFQAIPIYR